MPWRSWQRAGKRGVPAALERSRSGNGGHVWIFFSETVPGSEARKLGAHLITETMERCPDIGFESYDRFFPSQDTMPAGGFGNLIALPLQNGPRQDGNSVFVDEELRPYDDQWAFLSNIRRLSRAEVANLVEQASAAGRIVGVRLPLDSDDEEPWISPPSRRKAELPIVGVMPERVEVVLGNQLYIDRSVLPPALVNRLIRLAAFQNPEFYAAQAMRLPTFGKPRVISCAELFAKHIALPRGCFDAAFDLLAANRIRPDLRDERCNGTPIGTRFRTLTQDQFAAVDALDGARHRRACSHYGIWQDGGRIQTNSAAKHEYVDFGAPAATVGSMGTATRILDIDADLIGASAAEGSGRQVSSMSPPSKACEKGRGIRRRPTTGISSWTNATTCPPSASRP